jgi:hypothetical protein
MSLEKTAQQEETDRRLSRHFARKMYELKGSLELSGRTEDVLLVERHDIDLGSVHYRPYRVGRALRFSEEGIFTYHVSYGEYYYPSSHENTQRVTSNVFFGTGVIRMDSEGIPSTDSDPSISYYYDYGNNRQVISRLFKDGCVRTSFRDKNRRFEKMPFIDLLKQYLPSEDEGKERIIYSLIERVKSSFDPRAGCSDRLRRIRFYLSQK